MQVCQTLRVGLAVKYQNSAGLIGKIDAIIPIHEDDGLLVLAFLQSIDGVGHHHRLVVSDDRTVPLPIFRPIETRREHHYSNASFRVWNAEALDEPLAVKLLVDQRRQQYHFLA